MIKLKQGTDRIIRAKDIVDRNGDPLVVDGWTVIGVARANTVGGALLAVWRTNPTSSQALATAAGRLVELHLTAAMSSAWNCQLVVVQAKVISPSNQTERIIDKTFELDREALAA